MQNEKSDVAKLMLTTLSKDRLIYFIGIGGIGMSALARIFKRSGYQVAGSDCTESEILEDLRREGIAIHVGHDQRPKGVGLAVFSSAIYPDNEQRVWFVEQHIPIVHRSALLAYLLNHVYSVGVTGTHGKTTTSSLISYLAEKGGLDPSALIGGYMKNYGSNALFGSGKLVIAEVDESDKTQLACQPNITVLTNLEPDHLEHYQDMEEIRHVFRQYFAQLNSQSTIVYCGEEPELQALVGGLVNPKISYGFSSQCLFFATDIAHTNGSTSFYLHKNGREVGKVVIPILGEHNVLNTMAALAVLEVLGQDIKVSIDLLPGFAGVARRMDVLYADETLKIIDDYAHHPTEIHHVIRTLKRQGRRLIVAYEAHRYTRTRHLLHEFGSAFTGADVLMLTDIYSAGENPIAGIDVKALANAVRADFKGDCRIFAKEALIEAIQEIRKPGDIVAFLGAGDITHIARQYANRIKRKELCLH